MNRYVLVNAISSLPSNDDVLLVLKDKPEWQKGRLNLIGGKIEHGELPELAAVRELKEETGLETADSFLMGKIEGSWGEIYCYNILIKDADLTPDPDETEDVGWYNWDDVKDDPRLIPNLKVLIPMMCGWVTDWIIYDDGNEGRLEYQMKVVLKNE